MIRKGLVSSLFLLLVLSAGLQAQFARTYGGQYGDVPVKILTTPDGGFIVFGNSDSFPGRAWLIKLAADGSAEWGKAYAVPSGQPLTSACLAPDGGYLVAGGSNNFLWLMKIDSLGLAEWQKTIANSAANSILPYSVCPAADSGFFVIGYTKPAEDYDVWVIKLSSGGDATWQKAYALSFWEFGVCAEPAAGGGCVVAGKTVAQEGGYNQLLVFEIDALGAITWQKIYSPAEDPSWEVKSIRKTNDGGYVLTGWQFSAGNPSTFVIKIGEDGAFEWEKAYPLTGSFDIAETVDGGFIFVGDWNSDILVAKLMTNGDVEWANAFGGFYAEEGYSVVQTAAGDYAAVGRTPSFGAGGDDYCVLRIPSDGLLGSCRFCKTVSLEALTAEVGQADISMSIQDTSAAPQTAYFAVTDTSGSYWTYELCAEKKVLTIQSYPATVPPTSTSPNLGTHLYDGGSVVELSAAETVTLGGNDFTFSNWEGDVPGNANPITITITDDMTVRANYYYYGDWGNDDDGGGTGGVDWGDGSGGKHCFIATAAYRSPLHPAVRLLRDFRDQRLLTNGIGRAFVAAYYKWSPAAARAIGGSAGLRFLAKVLLLPVIAFAALVLKLGWIPALFLMAAVTALAFRRIRRMIKGRARAST